MAKLKSSKKSLRGSKRKAEFNNTTRIQFKEGRKAVVDAVKAGKKAEAKKLLPKAFSLIDKAVKKHVLAKNTAARYKSSLSKSIEVEKK